MFKCLINVMKKIFRIETLDCANCANKIEEKIKKINGVVDASINFLSGKFYLEANDDSFDKIFTECKKIIQDEDSDLEIIEA